MKHAYHIDRNNHLAKGDILKLHTIQSTGMGRTQMNIRGITEVSNFALPHIKYFDTLPESSYYTSPEDINSIEIDMYCEDARRTLFPVYPSRFQCIFACETKEETYKWLSFFGNSNVKIWEIGYTGNSVKLDAKLLKCDFLRGEQPDNLIRYWNKETTAAPLFELLVPLPVIILDDITQSFGL